MTEEERDGLASALDDFLRPYLYCCGYTQTFDHLHRYCRGLLSDLKRKSTEPIALASGCAVRTLQEFLRDHQWRHAQIRDQLQRRVGAELAGLPDDGLGNVGLVDETSAVKSGTKTPGVQRQYLGCVGKIDNGVVTVHLGVCKGRYKTLIDAELFLPEDWAKDRDRCADVLADLGRERRQRGEEVLPVQCAGRRQAADAGAGGFPPLERGTRLPGGQERTWLHAL